MATQAMAQAVAEGITAAGKTPELVVVSEIPADALKDEAAFALGMSRNGRGSAGRKRNGAVCNGC